MTVILATALACVLLWLLLQVRKAPWQNPPPNTKVKRCDGCGFHNHLIDKPGSWNCYHCDLYHDE